MTKEEWLICDDAPSMLNYLWSQPPYREVARKFEHYPNFEHWQDYLEIELPLYKFYLSCCRRIWPLLVQTESRKGIRLAEQFVEGTVDWEELSEFNYHVEGAAFAFERPIDQSKIDVWIESVAEQDIGLVNQYLDTANVTPQQLLKDAAYFTDHVMMYPSIQPKGRLDKEHKKFLCAALLRKYVDYPT